jgi:hypothetical protein
MSVLEHIGYVLDSDGPQAVRVSNAGNLVDSDGGHGQCPTGMMVFGLVSDEKRWPTIYPTMEAAWAAFHQRAAQCYHVWTMVSHEERHCSKCGAFEVMPDMD